MGSDNEKPSGHKRCGSRGIAIVGVILGGVVLVLWSQGSALLKPLYSRGKSKQPLLRSSSSSNTTLSRHDQFANVYRNAQDTYDTERLLSNEQQQKEEESDTTTHRHHHPLIWNKASKEKMKKKPLTHDFYDILKMEQGLMDQGFAKPDAFHELHKEYLDIKAYNARQKQVKRQVQRAAPQRLTN
ncbi:expressed unknown protein [Seminavis robusta]|uniref:Uncharacterized protein n=1 Tax=Seminavis robusta TaxID=568900 RepID=A0A9N8D818_9STRA|nr:expressed unknown protein [Seminavis robusta]|eukprot:Sro32_g020630.1 n/a (185) ;mRNA; f:23476-24030